MKFNIWKFPRGNPLRAGSFRLQQLGCRNLHSNSPNFTPFQETKPCPPPPCLALPPQHICLSHVGDETRAPYTLSRSDFGGLSMSPPSINALFKVPKIRTPLITRNFILKWYVTSQMKKNKKLTKRGEHLKKRSLNTIALLKIWWCFPNAILFCEYIS